MAPDQGNTVAIMVIGDVLTADYDIDKSVRIQFTGSAVLSNGSFSDVFEAVYCDELYKDRIEEERNGTSKSNQFTK